jgi:hypothetical protein
MKTITKEYHNGTLTSLHYQWTPGWSVIMFVLGILIGRALA